jgi:hypothetical protein
MQLIGKPLAHVISIAFELSKSKVVLVHESLAHQVEEEYEQP